METKPRSLPLTKRGFNFEMIMWIFTRLSALGMYAFVLFALIGALVMGARNQMNLADVIRWTFMSISTHVQSTNIPAIEPWASLLWKLAGSGFLLLAVTHGVHGLVSIADDYIDKPVGRQIVRVLSIIMVLGMISVGLYILWTQ